MMYAFNRDSTEPRHWDEIIDGMKETLLDVRLGLYGEDDLAAFCKQAVSDAQTNEKFEDAFFWGFDEARNLPSDARCQYFYQPTYLMTLILTNAVLQYSSLMELEGMKETLRKALRGCTGRNLAGAGYDALAEQHSNLRLFIKSNIMDFLAAYPALSEDFSAMLGNFVNFVGTMQFGSLKKDKWRYTDREPNDDTIVRVDYARFISGEKDYFIINYPQRKCLVLKRKR